MTESIYQQVFTNCQPCLMESDRHRGRLQVKVHVLTLLTAWTWGNDMFLNWNRVLFRKVFLWAMLPELRTYSVSKWEWGVCVCVCWESMGGRGWQDQMEKTVKKMFTKFYTTGDIKYNTGRKAVAEAASYNSLEKVSRLGWTKKYIWPLHQCSKYK